MRLSEYVGPKAISMPALTEITVLKNTRISRWKIDKIEYNLIILSGFTYNYIYTKTFCDEPHSVEVASYKLENNIISVDRWSVR